MIIIGFIPSFQRMSKKDAYKTTNEILIGLEYIYPDIDIIPKIRLALKRLTFDPPDDKIRLNDLLNLRDSLKNFPITPYLKGLLSAGNSREKAMAMYRLMDHLSYDPDHENFQLILKHSFISDAGQSEAVEKIMIQWLKDKSMEPGYEYCKKLVDLLLEKDFFERTEKTLNFYSFFHKSPLSGELKNFPITPYLKGLLSAGNSREKAMAMYRLMDHLSYDPDHENFQLILKHSFISDAGQSEAVEKIMIQWLKDKSMEPGYEYCKKLVDLLLEKDFFERTEKTLNFYSFFYKSPLSGELKNFPITPYLKGLLSAGDSREKAMAMYRLMDHLSDGSDYENFRLILKHSFISDAGQSEAVEKIMIQWLKDKSMKPGYEYCKKLVDLLLEKDTFEKTEKVLDFYNFFYQSFMKREDIRSFPVQPYLRNVLSAGDSREKAMAMYRLMDHLSDGSDYENFRLILKHSFISDAGQSEAVEKIMIQWLKDKSMEPGYEYCKKLVDLLLEKDFFERTEKTLNFYSFFHKSPLSGELKNFPITPYLKGLLSAGNSREKAMAMYRLMDHLSYDPDHENFQLILKHSFISDAGQSEAVEKIMIQWLKDKSMEPGYEYCKKLVDLLLEKDFFERTEKTLNFYSFFYKSPLSGELKNFPITPYLKGLLSAGDSREKAMAMYRLMDHLSDGSDYENFRLILKHSFISDAGQSEAVEKIMIQWLKDKSMKPGYEYCKKLVDLLLEKDTFEKTEKVLDFYNFFYQSFMKREDIRSFPVQPYLRNVLSAGDSREKAMAMYRLMDHLSDGSDYENFRLILKHSFISDAGQSEAVEKIMIQWLKDKSMKPGYEYCKKLVDLLLEKDIFIKIKKILEFYDFFYQETLLKQLKKAYQHFGSQDSSRQFLNFTYQVTGKSLFNQIKVIQDKHSDFPLHESFSKGQILSKLWARDCLMDLNPDSCKTGLVLCGWSGVLPNLLLEKLFHGIVSVDKNPDCKPVAIRLNYENHVQGRFNAVTRDIFDLNYRRLALIVNKFAGKTNDFNIIINTSCEHIKDFDKWYELLPEGQLLLLQSNDFFCIEEHVNCVASVEAFKAMAPMKNLLFEGNLPLENYTRFMLIGYK